MTPTTAAIFTGICKSVFLAYFSDVVQEDASRAQGPWAPLPMPGYVILRVIRAIVLSISAITTFRVYASDNADALVSLSFLILALKTLVINDVGFFHL